jgi:ADP-ribose pyrophosphatase YjhB (NUDIX family)
MSRAPIPTWFFVFAVVRLGRRFLLVHERKHGSKWYLPAGRVEPGEDLFTAAKREALEESGVSIELEGLLRVEHSALEEGAARMRVIFVARPVDDMPPKVQADDESLEARWFTLEEIRSLPLRGEEVVHIVEHVERGALIVPLSFLAVEGTPFRW